MKAPPLRRLQDVATEYKPAEPPFTMNTVVCYDLETASTRDGQFKCYACEYGGEPIGANSRLLVVETVEQLDSG